MIVARSLAVIILQITERVARFDLLESHSNVFLSFQFPNNNDSSENTFSLYIYCFFSYLMGRDWRRGQINVYKATKSKAEHEHTLRMLTSTARYRYRCMSSNPSLMRWACQKKWSEYMNNTCAYLHWNYSWSKFFLTISKM
jgi:hypothetical protein